MTGVGRIFMDFIEEDKSSLQGKIAFQRGEKHLPKRRFLTKVGWGTLRVQGDCFPSSGGGKNLRLYVACVGRGVPFLPPREEENQNSV